MGYYNETLSVETAAPVDDLRWAISALTYTPRALLTMKRLKRVVKVFMNHDPRYFQAISEVFYALDDERIDWECMTTTDDEEAALRSVLTKDMYGTVIRNMHNINALQGTAIMLHLHEKLTTLPKDSQEKLKPLIEQLSQHHQQRINDMTKEKAEKK